jgi:hypothetical protein
MERRTRRPLAVSVHAVAGTLAHGSFAAERPELVLLDGEQVVATGGEDRFGGVDLGVRRVQGDEHPGQVEAFE